MVDQTRANLDAAGVEEAINAALGDAGYYSETNATDLESRGIEPYLATERLKHHEKMASAAFLIYSGIMPLIKTYVVS